MRENSLDWKEYEAITKYIYETLGKEFGVTIEGYGITCKVEGRSGSFHQIDVLTKQSNGVHQFRTAIECKCLKNKVTKGTVMKLVSTIKDARIDKGVIVSKSGFASGAVNFAREYNIGLVELREAQENDFQEHSKEIHIGDLNLNSKVRITRPQILNIDIGNNQSIEIRDEWDYYNYIITLKNQTKIPLLKYVNEFRNEVNLQNKKGKIINKHYEIPNANLFNKKSLTTIEINEIIFTGQLIEIDASQSLSFKLVDQVWLIMKSIFEERVFTFSESGLIVERKSK
ncbi:restriction endonuclease [Flagellimonas okinawensis]|uniref:Restriction endonuclease n=1 Tax=Flagellimonas okinawensis TaxID=3031324 RepID=A0ABT5XP56_9FLAO|nr:restriction endonuclease [[Muricauda] okinawensis]MDF0707670.1 restriction endonuclease [[Muricauda] okinawensis]